MKILSYNRIVTKIKIVKSLIYLLLNVQLCAPVSSTHLSPREEYALCGDFIYSIETRNTYILGQKKVYFFLEKKEMLKASYSPFPSFANPSTINIVDHLARVSRRAMKLPRLVRPPFRSIRNNKDLGSQTLKRPHITRFLKYYLVFRRATFLYIDLYRLTQLIVLSGSKNHTNSF